MHNSPHQPGYVVWHSISSGHERIQQTRRTTTPTAAMITRYPILLSGVFLK
jgi:hypothetical protein